MVFKQFATGLRKDSPAFEFLHEHFPELPDAKIKKGVFAGHQIQKLILNDMFDKTLYETELAAWKSFKQVPVCLSFFGFHKLDEFKDVVADLLCNYLIMGCKMSLKVHFLRSHLPFFFMKTWEQFQISTMRDFIRTLLLLKKGSKESGQLECLPNTAGHRNEISLNKNA